jgi:hypothetical protein
LIGKLLAFWYAHGGDYGQSATAPSTEFVLDAAAPVIELRPGSVTNFVRSR